MWASNPKNIHRTVVSICRDLRCKNPASKNLKIISFPFQKSLAFIVEICLPSIYTKEKLDADDFIIQKR